MTRVTTKDACMRHLDYKPPSCPHQAGFAVGEGLDMLERFTWNGRAGWRTAGERETRSGSASAP
jgi:hypothetical protein